MIARHFAAAAFGVMWAGFGAFVPTEARAQTFDGITLIELKDPVGLKALGSVRGDYIISFVSGVGTYAAVLSTHQDRGCVAWAAEGSYTGRSITFGLAADQYEAKVAHPPICLPFTLAFEDGATVRVTAQNNVPRSNIPGAPAPTITYSRKRPVIDHVPLRAFDWGHASFARHHIKHVRLGPVQPAGGIDYELGPLRRSTTGTFKPLRASAGARDADGGAIAVQGRAAAKELTGWPWDVAYEAWHAEYLKPASTASAFQHAIIADLYGEPSIRVPRGGPWLWLYDLDGARLGAEDGQDSSCLRTREFWEGAVLIGANGDLGPWGCSLVMMLLHRPHGGMVSSYRLEVVSGYVKAINHFLARIEELEETRKKMRLIESVEPKL